VINLPTTYRSYEAAPHPGSLKSCQFPRVLCIYLSIYPSSYVSVYLSLGEICSQGGARTLSVVQRERQGERERERERERARLRGHRLSDSGHCSDERFEQAWHVSYSSISKSDFTRPPQQAFETKESFLLTTYWSESTLSSR